jgi:hypothetical protein
MDTPPTDFYSNNISGAQQLPNGGYIVCEGNKGKFFELDDAGTIIWSYINPVSMSGTLTQGDTPANNAVFRCSWYDPSYTGLTGLSLLPTGEIELDPLVPSLCLLMGEAELQRTASFMMAPNPASDQVILQVATTTPVNVTILNALGRIVMETLMAGGTGKIDVSAIPEGAYTLLAGNENGRWCGRLIVQ